MPVEELIGKCPGGRAAKGGVALRFFPPRLYLFLVQEMPSDKQIPRVSRMSRDTTSVLSRVVFTKTGGQQGGVQPRGL